MLKPLKAKTVQKTRGRGPGVKGAFPRYVSIGNAKKVSGRVCVFEKGDRRVFVDVNAKGNLIGVEII